MPGSQAILTASAAAAQPGEREHGGVLFILNAAVATAVAAATPARPPIDHTRWMAVVVELLAIVAAVVFAYLHAAQ